MSTPSIASFTTGSRRLREVLFPDTSTDGQNTDKPCVRKTTDLGYPFIPRDGQPDCDPPVPVPTYDRKPALTRERTRVTELAPSTPNDGAVPSRSAAPPISASAQAVPVEQPSVPPPARGIQRIQHLVWASRYLALVPVVASLSLAVALMGFAFYDAMMVFWSILSGFIYETLPATSADRYQLVARIIKVIDLCMISTFLLVFSIGTYGLFIGRIDAAEATQVGRRLLLVKDIDELKDRLGKIVILILALLFLEQVLVVLEVGDGSTEPMDLILLAGGTFLVSAGLWLVNRSKYAKGYGKSDADD